jgi:hypothetical protein
MVHGLFFSTTQKHKGTLFLSQNGPRNGPPFRIGQSAFTRLIPLHLTIKNPHIKKIHICTIFLVYFIMVLQYLGILSHIICISLQSFIAYLFIKHHCICVEAVTPEQEEGEPETVGDDTPAENQGRHLCIFSSIFWINEVYESCLCMSYYM